MQATRKPCAHCGATFNRRPAQARSQFNAQQCCSRACGDLYRRRDFTTRLWARIVVAGPDECWLWTGATIKNGYGYIGRASRADGNVLTHVAVYLERVGSIPAGFQIDHLCRVTNCCNPAHLEAVTQAENLRRQAAALKASRTHCANGHAWAEHGAPTSTGGRYCRTCSRDWSRRRYHEGGGRERRMAKRAELRGPMGETA